METLPESTFNGEPTASAPQPETIAPYFEASSPKNPAEAQPAPAVKKRILSKKTLGFIVLGVLFLGTVGAISAKKWLFSPPSPTPPATETVMPSASPEVTASAAAEVLGTNSSATPTPTVTGGKSPTPRPGATATPTPKPAATATPSPVPTSQPQNYALSFYDTASRMELSSNGLGMNVRLTLNGQTITDLTNYDFGWSVDRTDLARIDPRQKGFAYFWPQAVGTVKVTVKVYKMSGGVGPQVATANFPIEIYAPAPRPPKMSVTYPSEGQNITMSSGQTFCVVDVPQSGDHGNIDGLQRKQNINSQGWSSYSPESTLCYEPAAGANSLQLQYRNSNNEESGVLSVNFTFSRQ